MTSKITSKKKNNFKLKQGDEAVVITGKDKGKSAKILWIDRSKERLKMERVNLVKKHRKGTQEGRGGEIVEIPASMAISNVMIFCPECKTGVRIKLKRDGKKKQRYCHRCEHSFDKK